MQIVTTNNCPGCVKLKNMLNSLKVPYNQCGVDDIPDSFKSSISGFPAVFLGTNLIFDGAPGSIESLKKILLKFGLL